MKQSFQTIFYWILRILAALIMLQTLFFKFSGAEESVYIFTQMNMEPWGRYMTGAFELLASLLLLYRPTSFFGALIALGIMTGAIISHLTILGIEVKNDKGLLFFYASLVWVAALILLWKDKDRLLNLIPQKDKNNQVF